MFLKFFVIWTRSHSMQRYEPSGEMVAYLSKSRPRTDISEKDFVPARSFSSPLKSGVRFLRREPRLWCRLLAGEGVVVGVDGAEDVVLAVVGVVGGGREAAADVDAADVEVVGVGVRLGSRRSRDELLWAEGLSAEDEGESGMEEEEELFV